MNEDLAGASPVDRGVMAPVPEREFECLGDPAICDNPRGCGCVPERTYSRADLLTALAAERHACSIVVWMTLMEAQEPGADDKGLDGWMREAEQRVKNRQYEHDAMELGRELYADAQDAQKTRSQRLREAGFTRRMLKRGEEGVVCTRSTCQCEREGLGHQCIWLSYEKD